MTASLWVLVGTGGCWWMLLGVAGNEGAEGKAKRAPDFSGTLWLASDELASIYSADSTAGVSLLYEVGVADAAASSAAFASAFCFL